MARVHVVIPDEILKDVDALAGKGKRSEYIAEAARIVARRDRLVKAIEEGAGILSDEKYPYWSTPEKVARWLRDLRDTPSIRRDPLAEVLAGRQRGDRLAKREGTGARARKASRPKPSAAGS